MRLAQQGKQVLPIAAFDNGLSQCFELFRGNEPCRKAISSGQAMLRPWRRSMVWTKRPASRRESCVPVSSQAMPRLMISTFNLPALRYLRFRSVISSSPRGDGLRDAAISGT